MQRIKVGCSLLLVLASACTPSFPELGQCLSDQDCRGGNRCVNGSCVGVEADAGTGGDAMTSDLGFRDAAAPDVAMVDADVVDAGAADVEPVDAVGIDAAPGDGGATDGGLADAEEIDGAEPEPDGGIMTPDTGAPDAGPTDSGVLVDAGAGDGGVGPPVTCSSLRFDGQGDYVDVPYSQNLDTPQALTVEAWIKTDQPGGTMGIVTRADQMAGRCAYRLGMSNGSPQFCVYLDCFNPTCVSGNQILPNVWVHLAGVYENNQLRLYVDGQPEPFMSVLLPGIPSVNVGLEVGAFGSTGGRTQYFRGDMGSVRVSSSARYSGAFMPDLELNSTGSGTVLAWRLNEGMGVVAGDSSGFGNDGTIHGARWAQTSPGCTPYYLGRFLPDMSCLTLLHLDPPNAYENSCNLATDVQVTGAWDQLVASRIPALDRAFETIGLTVDGVIDTNTLGARGSEFTIEMTFRKDGPTFSSYCGAGTLYSDRAHQQAEGVDLLVQDDGRLSLRTYCRYPSGSSCGDSQLNSDPGVVQDGVWYHVAATGSLGSVAPPGLALFLDSADVARYAAPVTINWSESNSTALIGGSRVQSTTDCRLNGVVDEIRVSSIVRY